MLRMRRKQKKGAREGVPSKAWQVIKGKLWRLFATKKAGTAPAFFVQTPAVNRPRMGSGNFGSPAGCRLQLSLFS
jgi:hypothetical protein